MVNICKETGETPSVQELRKMADDLEEDIKFTLLSTDKVETTKKNKLPQISNLEREMEIIALGTSAQEEEEEFFDCYEEMFFKFFYEY